MSIVPTRSCPPPRGKVSSRPGDPGPRLRTPFVLASVLAGLAASPAPVPPDPGPSAQAPGALARYALREEPAARFALPRPLREISGLALDRDGRLFAHADEAGVVYEIDPTNGSVVREIPLGGGLVRGDFEGITVLEETFFLATSGGSVVRFQVDGQRAESLEVMDTGLAGRCEVEGLETHPATGELLLACKTHRGDLKDHAVVYAWDPRRPGAPARVWLDVGPAALEEADLDGRFHPSGLAWDLRTGHLLIPAARDERIVEIDPTGTIVDVVRLRKGTHPQTEGIVLTADLRLLLADEGQGHRGHLAVYRP